jgi:hypothetical protein
MDALAVLYARELALPGRTSWRNIRFGGGVL